jgi:CheY-like chemotaxis protein
MTSTASRILIAEDNPAMSAVIRFNLERAGFEVQVASTGRRAAELAATQPFDLIVTDYQMPEMSGAELCKYVRETLNQSDLPLVLCSAKGMEVQTAHLMVECSLSKVFFKPFSPQELVRFIQQTLAPAASL